MHHPTTLTYLWLLRAALIVVFIMTEMRTSFLSSCYFSTCQTEISFICFQDWPTASTSTKTAGPTLSTALAQSSAKKCKTQCICYLIRFIYRLTQHWLYNVSSYSSSPPKRSIGKPALSKVPFPEIVNGDSDYTGISLFPLSLPLSVFCKSNWTVDWLLAHPNTF